MRFSRCTRQADLEEFRISDQRIQWSAKLMRHDRKKRRFCLARCFGFEARFALVRQLPSALFRVFAIGNVPQRDERNRLTFPFRFHNAKLGKNDIRPGALDDIDLRRLANNERETELSSKQVGGSAAEQALRGRVGKADISGLVDDYDSILQLIDYCAKHLRTG